MRRFYKNLVMLFDLSLYREAILLDIYIKSSTQDCHALPSITQNSTLLKTSRPRPRRFFPPLGLPYFFYAFFSVRMNKMS